jgi:thiol-disulfide isomerase/thioredoxin
MTPADGTGRHNLVRWLVLGAGVAIVAVVAAVAFATGGSNGGSGGSAGSGGVSGAQGAGSTVATAFDLPVLGGPGRVRLADYRGKPVVVDLFASWCTACRSELPAFTTVARQLSGRVTFIAVDSLDDAPDGLAMARQYHLADSGFILAKDIGAGGGGLHDALRAPGMPATAFYDATGRLLYRAPAELSQSILRSKLQQLYGIT